MKGSASEYEIALSALTAALRIFDPHAEDRARASVPPGSQLTPIMLALGHQMSCRGNVNPDALLACKACAVCNGLWACTEDRGKELVASRPRGRPRHAVVNAIDDLLRQWPLSYAEVGRLLGCSRAAIKDRRRHHRAREKATRRGKKRRD